MAGRGRKVRKRKIAHAAANARNQREAQLQSNYISTYWTFKGYADSGSGPASTGRYNNPGPRGGWTARDKANKEWENPRWDSYDTFTWYSPESIARNKGGSITQPKEAFTRFTHAQAYSRRNNVATWRGISESYKDKAIKAEIGNLTKWTPLPAFDSSKIGSQRGRVGGTNTLAQAKAKNAKEKRDKEYTAVWGNVSQIGSGDPNLNPDWYVDGPPTDNFFGTLRDTSGKVLKHGSLEYITARKDLTPKQKKDMAAKKMQTDTKFLMSSTLKEQASKEKDYMSKLSAINLQLEDHETGRTNRYGDKYYTVSSERSALTKEKQSLEKKLQMINNDQSVMASAMASTDYNTMMRYLVKEDKITDETRMQYRQYSDPTKAVLKQDMQSLNFAYKAQQTQTTDIASDLAHLRYLEKNATASASDKRHNELNWFIEDLDNKYPTLVTPYDMGNTGTMAGLTSVAGIKKQLKKKQSTSQKEAQKHKTSQQNISLQLAGLMTNDERVANAKKINKTVKGKQKFEDLTGQKAGSSADQSMRDWYDNIGQTRPDKAVKGFRQQKGNADWFAAWLNNDSVFQRSDTSLTLDSDKNTGLQSTVKGKKSLMNKYDSWDQANSYIGGSLSAWKSEQRSYLGGFYSSPNITQKQTNMSYFGTEKIEGVSFLPDVVDKMGGVRGGDYFIQDIRKLLTKTDAHEKKMQSQIDIKSSLVTKAEAHQLKMQQAHNALKPEFEKGVDVSVRHGNITYDDGLAKRLEASSQRLYDAKESTNIARGEKTYMEKSLVKTIQDKELYKKQKKRREYDLLHGGDSSVNTRRSSQNRSPGRPNLKSFSRRNNGGGGQRKTRGGKDTLGGLVI